METQEKGTINIIMPNGETVEWSAIASGIDAGASPEEVQQMIDESIVDKANLVNGVVPEQELPSYVDDVVEYSSQSAFPQQGDIGKIYVALDTGLIYRWSGSQYVQIAAQDNVVEVADYASLPVTGQAKVIYITKDTNKQYRWDATNGYVELSVEDEVEFVTYTSGNTLTQAQLNKAKKGKLIIKTIDNIACIYCGLTAAGSGSGKQVHTFFAIRFASYSSSSSLNVVRRSYFYHPKIEVDPDTLVMSSWQLSAINYVEDISSNFFASNVNPVADGKRLVREMNVAGKLIPTYSASDAGKVVKINSSGTGVELGDIETATELEVNRLFRTEYAITSTITNGSSSGDTSIWTKETASVTIVPSSGYILPETVIVSGATYSYDDSTGIVVLSAATGAVTISATCIIEPPAKGDIITLDGGTARYRVLKTNGTVAEVLALDDVANSAFNSSSVTTTFSDGSEGQKYENSTLDNYMNSTFYNSLSSNIKAAIVQKAVTQSIYQFGSSEISGYDFAMTRIASGTRWYKRKGQVSVGNRYCYALDLDDVAEYLGAGSGNTVSGADLNDMFFEQTTAISKYVWLDSAYSDYSDAAFYVRGGGGVFDGSDYYDSRVVRPAFQVDLSQVLWVKE